MDAAAWREANRVRVKLLYTTLRTLYEALGGPGTFLVAGVRLGGRHGYDEDGAVAPLGGGGVTGLAKSFKRGKPGALVKAVDFPAGRQTAALADALIEETLRDPGAVEIGRDGERRWTIASSTRCLYGTGMPPRMPASAVTIAFGFASSMRVASEAAAKPPKTTEWTAPMRAQASIANADSAIIGM